ncbi:MAG: hypothetical protein HGB03_02540 [Candidatus Yonathbacteria bacterium]|nr:hypothetical protein [Candidatus Yonathbacteria bacterium]NTW47481.1 hypothetical protein [Candidatus Yonathbacteria bacterium]
MKSKCGTNAEARGTDAEETRSMNHGMRIKLALHPTLPAVHPTWLAVHPTWCTVHSAGEYTNDEEKR